MTYGTVVDAIPEEIERARALFPGQERTVPLAGWLGILVEEVGEVARLLNERLLGTINDGELLAGIETELIQVGAMAALMHSAAELQLETGKTL